MKSGRYGVIHTFLMLGITLMPLMFVACSKTEPVATKGPGTAGQRAGARPLVVFMTDFGTANRTRMAALFASPVDRSMHVGCFTTKLPETTTKLAIGSAHMRSSSANMSRSGTIMMRYTPSRSRRWSLQRTSPQIP